jgi:hypothetical protein
MSTMGVPFPIDPRKRLFSRAEVLQRPSPVPRTYGLYAWYFRNAPTIIPTDSCLTFDGKTLLYLGIAPDKANKPNSRSSLFTRIRYHYRGNAEGSTLRRTLGVILEKESGFGLRRVGSGKRITLTHEGERWLDDWMDTNAFVAWSEHPAPWTIERELLHRLSCPLNIDDNAHHPYYPLLRRMRREAVQRARNMPIANEHNQKR